MAKKALRGAFITFEGSEGCGKSTQSKLLYLYLKRKGFDALYLREPGAVKISEKIRKILLDAGNGLMSRESEMLLYMAARAQLVHEAIAPALKAGKVVICDRFLDSTIAYQGYGLGMDIAMIRRIGELATAAITPHLTMLLDLPVKAGLKHRHLTKDRIEKRSLGYHARVRRGYLALAQSDRKRIKIVKVDKDKAVTQGNIRSLAMELLWRLRI